MSALPFPIDSNAVTCGLRVESRSSQDEISADEERVAEGIARHQVCSADLTRNDLTGLQLGPYALGQKIGGGGMGQVFTARHMHLDRLFAIKFIGSEIASYAEVRQRFEQEVKTLGKLQHPQIINAVDAGCINGLQYLVTELVSGEDLAQLVKRRGTISVAEACELIRQASVGLEYLHNAGYLHRDIKPSNLILDLQSTLKILDFGLVRSTVSDLQLTVQGEMLGTWDYVAPEQAQDARQVDHRADIYSLGCTLIYLLSGHAPFSDARYSTVAAKLKGHLFDMPSWFDNVPAHIPAELIKILQRMLAKSPEHRFASAGEVAIALQPWAEKARVMELMRQTTTEVPSLPQAVVSSQGRLRSTTMLCAASTVALMISGGMYLANVNPANQVPRVADQRHETPSTASEPAIIQNLSSPSGSTSPASLPVNDRTRQEVTSDEGPKTVTHEPKKTFSATAIRMAIPGPMTAKPKSFAAPAE